MGNALYEIEMALENSIGRIRLIADESALVGLYTAAQMAGEAAPPRGRPGEGNSVLAAARRQLVEWLAGERTAFSLPIRLRGTPFQHAVWEALQSIPFGETWSYAALARRVGRPAAIRAVGAANARNPISIVVPCHRVVGSDGSLTGYAGGLAAKQWLLSHEAAVRARRCDERAAPMA